MKALLPTRLGKSPLVDAIFEVRFSGEAQLSSILTGILYANLNCSKVDRLPNSDLPEFIRQADANLKYAVYSRLTWDNYYIGVGDNVLTLSPMPPYPGWKNFKQKIETVIEQLSKLNNIQSAERFSLKYIDILDENIHHDIYDTLNIGLALLDRKFNQKTLQIRVEVPKNNGMHLFQVIGQAVATLPDASTKTGILVDIDSIQLLPELPKAESFNAIHAQIDELHQENKELFFKLLTENGLARLEAVYD